MNRTERLIEFFKNEDMYDEKVFEYINSRTHVYPFDTDPKFFGCYPKVENGTLIDINLIVPETKTLKNFLINVHEYTHAIDLYNELGKPYVEDREKFEKRAEYMERKYIQYSFDSAMKKNEEDKKRKSI